MPENTWTKIGFENELIDEIRNAKDHILIASPWISKKYAQLLKDKSKEGVTVNLVTSDDTNNKYHKQSLEELTTQKTVENQTGKKYKTAIGTTGLLGITTGILNHILLNQTTIGYIISTILLFTAGGLFYYLQTRKQTWEPAIDNLKIIQHNPYEKLHSKIYIIDETGYTGSVNLTDTAINRNLETLVQIEDQEHINKMGKKLDNIELAEAHLPEVAERSRNKEINTQKAKNKLTSRFIPFK